MQVTILEIYIGGKKTARKTWAAYLVTAPAIGSLNIHIHKNMITFCSQKVFFHSAMELHSHALNRSLKEKGEDRTRQEDRSDPVSRLSHTNSTCRMGQHNLWQTSDHTPQCFRSPLNYNMWLSYFKGANVIVFWKLSKAEKILPHGNSLTIENNQHFQAVGTGRSILF